ncbi:MAG: CCA tRNA nucleotidyltransferase [Defluviitaleaceae bacterium]|nr:CCA tRNA nucleotidyltransferase [Defluviitaleaceae bacterium]
MKIVLPANVTKIISMLESHGHEAYIVGGCVRDSVRGVVPKDWDITTSATPHEVVEIFSHTVETGIKHGTVTVIINRLHYEVTTYRIDGEYLDSRRPQDVIFTSNIYEDLSRRDFTMNAIAYNPACGFADPYEGQKDIAREIIRCVGNPTDRFKEDALRMLRAVRFAGQLGFTLEKETHNAIISQSANLVNISAERIREEIVKLLTSPYIEAVKLLETTDLLPYILIDQPFGGDTNKIISQLEYCPDSEPLRLALFLSWSGDNCEKLLRTLRFDNKTISEVARYVNCLHTYIPLFRYEIKKYLRHMPQAHFENLLTLQSIVKPYDAKRLDAMRRESRDIQEKGECYTLKDLSVNGIDLAEVGIPPGKAIGDKLEELLDAVMRDPALNADLHSLL